MTPPRTGERRALVALLAPPLVAAVAALMAPPAAAPLAAQAEPVVDTPVVVVPADDLAERAQRLLTASFFEAPAAALAVDEAVLQRIDSLLLAAVAEGVTPGAALAIGRAGGVVRLRGYGTLDRSDAAAPTAVAGATPPPVAPLPPDLASRLATPATLYDLASLTKVVGTTTAVMLLDEEGRLDLDRPVVDYLPWWDGGHAVKRDVTVRQLLLHRSGLPSFRRWFTELEGDTAYRRAVAAEPLESAPGERTVYSDHGAMTLAWIVEAVAGEPLDRFLERRVWRPLGMTDTGFRPDPALLDRIAPTELDTLWRGAHVHGVVHDENADAAGGVAGHAGLFSTAWDLSIFARTLLRGGTAPACAPTVRSGVPCSHERPEPVTLLETETIERYTARHDERSSRALGWDTPSGRSSAGDLFTADAFGHTGFTGTSVWIDPELDLFVVLLTNRVNPTREEGRHVPLRRAVHDLAARALLDRSPAPRPDTRR